MPGERGITEVWKGEEGAGCVCVGLWPISTRGKRDRVRPKWTMRGRIGIRFVLFK
jgi:hypothetical protein